MTTKQILGTAVGLGSLALVGKSAKLAKDSFKSKPKSKKLVKDLVDLSIGTSLLTPISSEINKL